MLQDFDEAVEAFQKVLELEPSNKAAQTQLTLTRRKVKALRDRERKRYANMFDKLSTDSKDEEQATKWVCIELDDPLPKLYLRLTIPYQNYTC